MNRRGFVKQIVAAVGGLVAWFTYAKPTKAACKIHRGAAEGAYEVEEYEGDGLRQTKLYCRGSLGNRFHPGMVAQLQDELASIMAEVERWEDVLVVWDKTDTGGWSLRVGRLPEHMRRGPPCWPTTVESTER